MDYTSTLETLEGFWMTLSRCSKHLVRDWAILYSLVKVRNPWNCSLYSTRCLVYSHSINKHAIKVDYTSTLETLESFLNPLSMSSAHRVAVVWRSCTHWLRLAVLGIAHGSKQCALFNLSQLLSMPYRWIRRVL